MEINKSHQVKSVAFQGYQHKKTDTGAPAYQMNCMYDPNKYTCELECFHVTFDEKNGYKIKHGMDNRMDPFFSVEVPPEGVMLEPDYDLDLEPDQPFGFRFKLTPIRKDGEPQKPAIYVNADNEEIEGCTIMTRKGTTVLNQGPMYLGMPDTFDPRYIFAGFEADNTGEIIDLSENDKSFSAKIRKASRVFSNSMGGTMAGFIKKIPELRDAGYKRLITTPLLGGDRSSAYKYWPENNMLVAGNIGSRNDYNTLQKTAFRYGMSTVDDGTFSSEGLQGIHYQRAIKWMDNEEKPDEYYYFRMSGLQDDALGLGVVPKNCKNLNNKIVNAPFDIVQKSDGTYATPDNPDYDPEKPTYIQIFDNTLVSDEQRKDKKHIFTRYAKTNPDEGNKLAMNTHDDTNIPYHFEISNPYELKRNIENLNEVNKHRDEKINLNSARGTMFIGSLSGIKIRPKTEGGVVCWNANTDMVKYNYFTSNYDNELLSAEKDPVVRAQEMENLRRGNCQIRDMATQVARYRTRNVRNLYHEYTAKMIGVVPDNTTKAYDKVEDVLNKQKPNNPILPEDVRVSQAVVENVLNGNYEMRPKIADYKEALVSSLMDLPLDSIEFAPDTQGALSSPYISKLSPDKEHIGETRYNALHDKTYKVPEKYAKTYNKMNDIFTKDMVDFADKVLKQVDANSDEKLFTPDGKMTEYGKYMVPLVGQDIARYAITKGLMPDAKAKALKGGDIVYDYDHLRENGTLLHMGVNGDSQQNEANQLLNAMKKGINKLSNSKKDINFVADSINKRFENTNANGLKLAEVMVDRSGLGLDWRYDAAKDVADIDSLRNGDQSFDTAWKNNIEFWGDMSRVIKEENPNSYQVAEFTDVQDVINKSMPDDGNVIYNNEGKAVGVLMDLTGLTSEANYSFFFDGITNMFAYNFADGKDQVGNNDGARVSKLDGNLYAFSQKSNDYKRNSYTFASNHDKPRMVHCLSMDMELYNLDLCDYETLDKIKRKPGQSDEQYNAAKGEYDHYLQQRKRAYKIMNNLMYDKDLHEHDWEIIKGKEQSNYFSGVSAKSVANGELLRNSIGFINEDLRKREEKKINEDNSLNQDEKNRRIAENNEKYKQIYVALSDSVADVVNGKYYKTEQEDHEKALPDSLKKANEKEGFGTKSIPDAFDIVYDQAVAQHGLDKYLSDDKEVLNYRNAVDSKATEVGRAKTRIIMRYLGALAGNPTLYAGDELGMTGQEDKCENTYNNNRGPLDWSMVEKGSDNYREDIDKYRKSILDISWARGDNGKNLMEAINNGSMQKLNVLPCEGGSGCPAVMYQASNGAMNISVFNPNGIQTSPYLPEGQTADSIKPRDVVVDKILLKGAKGNISLKPGTEFKNTNPNDENTYVVYNDNEHPDEYYVRIKGGDKGHRIPMNPTSAPDGVMVLYHIPEKVQQARDDIAKRRKYYNPVYNIPPSQRQQAYNDVNKDEPPKGTNIDVTSK